MLSERQIGLLKELAKDMPIRPADYFKGVTGLEELAGQDLEKANRLLFAGNVFAYLVPEAIRVDLNYAPGRFSTVVTQDFSRLGEVENV